MSHENDERVKSIEDAALVSAPIIAELKALGFSIETISDLYRKKLNYKDAVPILLRWLPIVENRKVRESIIRALSVKWAKPIAARPLVEAFRKSDDKSNIGIKWTIGNALSVVADDEVLDDILEFVQDKRHGRTREMLAIALGNMSDARAVEVLIDLLDDEEIAGHAIMALGQLRSEKARPRIEKFLNHEKGWIRKEAGKAIKKIDDKTLSADDLL